MDTHMDNIITTARATTTATMASRANATTAAATVPIR